MADKMMRIAGRDTKGVAKPIKISEDGNVSVEKPWKILMDEKTSGARTLNSGEEWESPMFTSSGLSKLSFFTSLNRVANYRVRVSQGMAQGEFLHEREREDVIPAAVNKGNVGGQTDIIAPFFKVFIKNQDDEPIKIGLFLYLT